MSSYQEVLTSIIGDFGLGQLIISMACIIPKWTTAWGMIMIGFSSSEPNWWRQKTMYNSSKLLIEYMGKNNFLFFDSCFLYIFIVDIYVSTV